VKVLGDRVFYPQNYLKLGLPIRRTTQACSLIGLHYVYSGSGSWTKLPIRRHNDVLRHQLSGTTQLWKVLEPRLGPLTDNFWTVSALFSASQSWPNFLVIKDEKYFCLVYGLLSPPIGQDFLSATFVLSWRQDFALKKRNRVQTALFRKSWPHLESLGKFV
jgi:hypothetical protein